MAESFQRLGEAAVAEVRSGMVLGLGTGRAAQAFVEALAMRVRAGLTVTGIPTSHATRILAERLGIPLTSFDAVVSIDLAVDGADEVDPRGHLIKGHGGALLREKVVASAASRVIIVVASDKMVDRLGRTKALPVEVIPFAASHVRRQVEAVGCPVVVRKDPGGAPMVTDNGNHVLDVTIGDQDPESLERRLQSWPGVVETGFFFGVAHVILIQHPDRVETRTVTRSRAGVESVNG